MDSKFKKLSAEELKEVTGGNNGVTMTEGTPEHMGDQTIPEEQQLQEKL